MAAIRPYPKPYDVIPYGEADAKKSLTIANRTRIRMNIGQINSTWDQVRFVLTESKNDSQENTKWLAELEPGDIIELYFSPAKPIEK